MFKKVLIANRGEIAVRVIRACQELGIKTVSIFSKVDSAARHVSEADECRQLEGEPAAVYLDIAQIIGLARQSGAQAIHPGYGFLAENADFAAACSDAGLTFIGPTAAVVKRMGNKVEARRVMEAAGVPVVPGAAGPVESQDAVFELGTRYGYPLAIKASAGGGGRGFRVVNCAKDIEQALAGAAREGASYFGNKEVYVEKYLDRPHHVEVQILADNHGNIVHLYERDCSSQRRHQKLLEETPAPLLSRDTRRRLLDAAVRGAQSIGYRGAGTIECLVHGQEFYFLEVNTRIQVEHPITELVTGVDIVKEQILIAAGQALSFKQEDIVPRGHAIECRINAEDPFKNFMPSPGTITAYREPQMPWVRVDSACYNGYQVLPFYDSLLAKLVVWGRTRQEAIDRMRVALAHFEIAGVSTTIPFHLQLLDDPAFQAGQVYTDYVEKELKPRLVLPAVTIASPGQEQAPASGQAISAGHPPGGQVVRKGPRSFEVEVDRRQFKVSVVELVDSGNKKDKQSRPVADLDLRATKVKNTNGSGEIKSDMHGLVKEVLVAEGDQVKAGQRLMIFEAMKMESEIVSCRDGRILALKVKPGETVEGSSILAIVGD